jgi:hypothetical protein
VDFNGDRCTDRQVALTILVSACSGTSATTVTLPAIPVALLDWNGDHKTDVLVDNGGTIGVYLSDGAGLSSLITTSLSSSSVSFDLDQDGDGLDDFVKVNGTGAINYWTHTATGSVPTYATNVPDLLASVTDGFGVNQTINYVSTAWSNYDKGAATNFPLEEADPSIVVAQVTASNGVGSTFNKTYSYVGARKNAERDENVGFQRFDETDSRNSVITRKYFEQSFPVAGMLSQTEVMQPGGTTTMAREVFTNAFATLDTTTNNWRYFTYSSGSTATQYEAGGVFNAALVRTVTTANTFDTASGTLYDQTVTTTEPASGANGVTAGGSWVARSYSPLANLLNDTTNWCLGRPQQTQAINSSNLTYGSSLSRTTNISWNATACRPTQTVSEPGDPDLEVTTVIGYDGFGNVNSTSVTGVGMTARTNTSVYSDATFTSGQFPLSTTNALSQQTNSLGTMTWVSRKAWKTRTAFRCSGSTTPSAAARVKTGPTARRPPGRTATARRSRADA